MLDQPDAATAAALARLYDLDLIDDPGDLDLYLALADRAEGPILELAVGTGRVAIPLVEAGHRVTGVDLDPAMLERARARAHDTAGEDRLTLVEADIVGLRLADAGSFGLAFIALNSLLVLPTRSSQRAALRAMADHLAPGGLAVVDVWLPDADDLGALDPALQQGIEQDHVRAELADARYDPAPIRQDVEELDARLGVQQAPDVLGDLRDVFDDEEARLVTRWHPPDDTTRVGGLTQSGGPGRKMTGRWQVRA